MEYYQQKPLRVNHNNNILTDKGKVQFYLWVCIKDYRFYKSYDKEHGWYPINSDVAFKYDYTSNTMYVKECKSVKSIIRKVRKFTKNIPKPFDIILVSRFRGRDRKIKIKV